MTYSIKFSPYAAKQFHKLSKPTQQKISNYLNKIQSSRNPKDLAKSLSGPLSRAWRFRIGKYRLICNIHEDILIVEIIKISKRDKAYK